MAPLIFMYLLDQTDSWVPIAGYIAVVGVLTLIGLALGRDPDPSEDEYYVRIHDQAETLTPAAGLRA